MHPRCAVGERIRLLYFHQEFGPMSNAMDECRISRRAVLRGGALLLASAAFSTEALSSGLEQFALDDKTPEDIASKPVLRIGLVTDLHYADKPAAGSRHYRLSLERLEKAAAEFDAAGVDAIVELGDLVDAADSAETELAYLKAINAKFSAAKAPRHYVLGNHCVDTLTKEQFLGGVAQEKSYYSFDVKDHHFVVLDACFRADGKPYGAKNSSWDDANLAAAELEWLAADLAATKLPTLVFIHQRLDTDTKYAAKNAADARKVLEASKKVLAVFQGHEHKNNHREIAGIHYTTLAALVETGDKESNAFAVLDVFEGGKLAVRGFAKQVSYDWR
jgi:predicted MPP superfamily phosphohydrolase